MGLILGITLSFIVVAYVGYMLVEATMLRKARIRKRMAAAAPATGEKQGVEPSSAPAAEDQFPTISKVLQSKNMADRLMLMLMQAGLKLRPSEFVGLACGLALLLAILIGVFFRSFIGELLGLAAGLAIPFIYVKGLQAQRLTAFGRQIPDTLALISSALRSGFSFQRALAMVAEEMPAPISEEFQRVIDETNVGLGTDVALLRMAARVPSYDLQLVVTAVIIQQQIGGNLAEIIDNICDTVRERIKIEGELAALTSEGRISGIILSVLPLVLAALVSIVNPQYLKPLVEEAIGPWIIATAVGLQVLGAIIVKRMLVLDY